MKETMINEHELDPALYLVSQMHDGDNDMQVNSNGLGHMIKNNCPITIPMHCLCHIASLPVKNLFEY